MLYVLNRFIKTENVHKYLFVWVFVGKDMPMRSGITDCANRCLVSAGGDSLGTLDFYQMHTYAWQGQYSSSSPLNNDNYFYSLDKPNVIGLYILDLCFSLACDHPGKRGTQAYTWTSWNCWDAHPIFKNRNSLAIISMLFWFIYFENRIQYFAWSLLSRDVKLTSIHSQN